jgi:hypothetical protein
MIFDDDSVLYEHAIDLCWNTWKSNGDAVYGLMGVIENEGDNTDAPPKPQFVHGEFLMNVGYYSVDVLGGYRGVLYPLHLLFQASCSSLFSTTLEKRYDLAEWVNFFVEEHHDHNLLAMHDDHIFAYYCKYHNLDRRVVFIPNAQGNLFYEPIGNTDGIFNDTNSEKSYQLVQKTYSKLEKTTMT